MEQTAARDYATQEDECPLHTEGSDGLSAENVLEDEESSSDDSGFQFVFSTQPAIVRIELDKFQEELEPYRLPLEKLTLSEQQMQAPDWINEILTSPHLNFRKKFFTNLKKLLQELRVDWDSEIHIFSLIHMVVPRTSESISYLKESY
ncbi:hypothetical protein AVEN_240823-1, partial [Araneus ventricosus]